MGTGKKLLALGLLLCGLLLIPITKYQITTPPLPPPPAKSAPDALSHVSSSPVGNFARLSCSSTVPPIGSKEQKNNIGARDREKKKVEAEIRNHGGGISVLGKIEVVQSDVVTMDNGESQRQSVVKSSGSPRLVLVIEHFAANGTFEHTSFNSAEEVVAYIHDKIHQQAIMSTLSALGYNVEIQSGWPALIVVRTTPIPENIFATKESLEKLVGSAGSVVLASTPSAYK